jgi:hypothetical protein
MRFDPTQLEQLQLEWAQRLEEAHRRFMNRRTPESTAEYLRVLRVFTRLAHQEVSREVEEPTEEAAPPPAPHSYKLGRNK